MKVLKLSVVMMMVCGVFLVKQKKEVLRVDDLALLNIEALAQGEGGGGYRCLGSGSLVCPTDDSRLFEFVLQGNMMMGTQY